MKRIIGLFFLIFSNAFAQTVYLECSINDNRQSLAVNYTEKTVVNFAGDLFKAKITDASISWEQTYGESTYVQTLNRYTGVYNTKCLNNCTGYMLPMKCEKRTEKKF